MLRPTAQRQPSEGVLRAISPPGEQRRREARALRRRLADIHKSHEDLLRQMMLAEQVQRSMLPRLLPALPGVTFAAELRPTQHMAGDFYSAFRLDKDHVGFYVGDVMGHGPAAALLSVYAMLRIQTKRIEGRAYEILEPGAVLAALNDELLRCDFPGMPFLTMVYGILDLRDRTLTYSSGGHPHPLILRAGEPTAFLEPTAPLLGIFESGFTQRSITLRPRDRLIFYSDGALTANWGCDGFGTDGLAARLGRRDGSPLALLLDDAMRRVRFDDHHPDDIAVVAVELTED